MRNVGQEVNCQEDVEENCVLAKKIWKRCKSVVTGEVEKEMICCSYDFMYCKVLMNEPHQGGLKVTGMCCFAGVFLVVSVMEQVQWRVVIENIAETKA